MGSALDKNVKRLFVVLPVVEIALVIGFIGMMKLMSWYDEKHAISFWHDIFVMAILGIIKVGLLHIEVLFFL